MQTFRTHTIRLEVGDILYVENEFGQSFKVEVPAPGEDEAGKLTINTECVTWFTKGEDDEGEVSENGATIHIV